MSFEFRKLTAADIVPMSKILSKIGIEEFADCFSTKEKDEDKAGMKVAFSMANIILAHIEYCDKEIFTFLANISGMKIQHIKELSIADFAEMMIALISKEEFKDFIQVVSRLLK